MPDDWLTSPFWLQGLANGPVPPVQPFKAPAVSGAMSGLANALQPGPIQALNTPGPDANYAPVKPAQASEVAAGATSGAAPVPQSFQMNAGPMSRTINRADIPGMSDTDWGKAYDMSKRISPGIA